MSITYENNARLLESARAGDESAAEQAVEANMPLVVSIARRYCGRAEFEDLVQIGSLGLLKAVRRFDPSQGVRFSTYAVPVIAGEIKRFLRDDGMIKVSRRLKETASAIAAINSRMLSERGREASPEELQKELMVEKSDIAAAMDAALPCLSIEGMQSDDAGPNARIPDAGSMEAEALDRVLIGELLSGLGALEREVICRRYFAGCTQKETGQALGLTQVQVSRIESKAVKRLKEAAGEQ